jgi:hypothetical protein
MGGSYIKLGEKSKALNILGATCDEAIEYLKWYESLKGRHQKAISSDYAMRLSLLQMLIDILEDGGEPYRTEVARYKAEFDKYYRSWRKKQS